MWLKGTQQSKRAPAAQELDARHQAALQEREHAAAAQLASARLQANALQARAHAETTTLAAEVRGACTRLFRTHVLKIMRSDFQQVPILGYGLLNMSFRSASPWIGQSIVSSLLHTVNV